MSGPESFGTNKIGAAITPGSSGVASRTFYGDGSYDLFTTQNETLCSRTLVDIRFLREKMNVKTKDYLAFE